MKLIKLRKRSMRRIVRRCAALCRWILIYRKRVRSVEAELGSPLEAC